METKQHTSNNRSAKEKVSNEKKKIELNETENIIFQHMWDTDKQVLRRTFTAVTAYAGKEESL